MYQQEVELIPVQLEFQPDMGRQRPKISSFFGPDQKIGLGNGNFTHILFRFCFVRTTAIIAQKPDTLVVISCYGRNTPFLYFVYDFIRPDIVADQIA